jgi:hypothetical protein
MNQISAGENDDQTLTDLTLLRENGPFVVSFDIL